MMMLVGVWSLVQLKTAPSIKYAIRWRGTPGFVTLSSSPGHTKVFNCSASGEQLVGKFGEL